LRKSASSPAPLFVLHNQQSAWRFSGSSVPPADFGTMWSTSSARSSADTPQSSQRKWARFNVSYRCRPGMMPRAEARCCQTAAIHDEGTVPFLRAVGSLPSIRGPRPMVRLSSVPSDAFRAVPGISVGVELETNGSLNEESVELKASRPSKAHLEQFSRSTGVNARSCRRHREVGPCSRLRMLQL
jgi:hypothetical protein